MFDPLVTYPPPASRAQIQPYLGVEHRIESIHIHIFTYQLQEEIRGHLRVGLGGGVGPLGLPGQGLQDSSRKERAQPRLTQDCGLTLAQNGVQRTEVPKVL